MKTDKTAACGRPAGMDRRSHARPTQGYRRGLSGITLIELMIVVAIVGILAAIAYPSYREQVIKARRTDATGALMALATQLEKFAYRRGTYAGATVTGLMGRTTSQEGYYQQSIAAATGPCPIADCYVIQSTPVAGTSQAEDAKCASFTLSSTGVMDVGGTCASGADDCVDQCW